MQPMPVDVLLGYALWAESYPAQAHNALMATEEAAMLNLLPADLSGQRCLDVACGSGRYLHILRTRHAAVLGLDLSPHMLQQLAIQNSEFTKVCPAVSGIHNYLQASFQHIPLQSNSVDVITCGLSVGHEPDLTATMAEMARVLRPNGRLLYSDIHPNGTRAGWQRTFTAADGRLLSVAHHLHSHLDHQRACEQAGLKLQAMLEPSLPGGSMPVVLVISACLPN